MFTGSTKLPPTKTPQPERLDEVYAALRKGLQSYLQVHQLELDSLGQQIRENKKNSRLGSLYELDKQVKAIERFMRRLEFHLSKVEELYEAYCIQRRLRDGASKMVAAFNSATGSKEARESLSEANKGYKEYTEHMCSLENEIESQMGEFHVKMKGLAGFARLCAGDQYEVLMRYGRQRWRLRGRVEVSNKQIWDSEDFTFQPLVTELLSIKVTELKSLANHVVVGSVSCEMLDLFCPLPQTLAVDINDLGTVKLNLEVTWSPFDRDDQTSSSNTVSKRLLSNQSPPDTPSMREQVFYSLLKRQGEMENGTVWSNSSESSDDSSSPALAHHTQRLMASNLLQTTPTTQLSLAPHKSSVSTPSLSSNQEEDETEGVDIFPQQEAVPNGHLQAPCSDCGAADRASVQSEDIISETSAELLERVDTLAADVQTEQCEESSAGREAEIEEITAETFQETQSQAHLPVQESKQTEDTPAAPFPTSASFNQEVETALESFDFLNFSDVEEEEEQQQQEKEELEGRCEEDQNKTQEEKILEEKHDEENVCSEGSDEEEADGLEFLMEAPEGFRNSDEDRFSESQESSVSDVQDFGPVEILEEKHKQDGENGDGPHEEESSHDQHGSPSTPS
ncbi:rho family-interacting cell polarization regulator 1-like isoform X1 [Cyprinodon tularosa]|uniref:rho family-interacting cell polarization regulator 1-like isoform X1 n=1 Tax=Cyprinodon tularosa TaxID=77115 RepID=UPI0018E2130A|nr:rho family-interacting cell polarization regulator 1-like isoform X1 [Cyprinodon tularosa]